MWRLPRHFVGGAFIAMGSSLAVSRLREPVSCSAPSSSLELPFSSFSVRTPAPAAGSSAAANANNNPSSSSSRDDFLKWDGKVAVRTMLAAFSQAREEMERGGDISPACLIEAARGNVALYGHIFGKESFLAKILAKTTARQLRKLENTLSDPSTPPAARESLKSLLLWEVRERGAAWANNRQSCAYCVKWLGRGLSFIGAFMAIFSTERAVAPHTAARRAYDIELGPFHGAFVVALARTAIYYAPRDRMKLYVRFSYVDAGTGSRREVESAIAAADFSAVDNQVCGDLAACSSHMLPVLSMIKSFLEDHKLNSPDKSVVVFAAKED